MKARSRRSSVLGLAALGGLCLSGCVALRPRLDQALQTVPYPPARQEEVLDQYPVRCPDVIEVEGRPEWAGVYAVGPDGRVSLGPLGRPRVEGLTPPEIARGVADLAGLPDEPVRVRVVEFHSQQLALFGGGAGPQRVVAYRGPETVVEVLRRAGGITSGVAAGDVYLVRPNVADGRPPQVFPVDLRAILLDGDGSTDRRVEPFDQIHVGETRKSYLRSCVAPCLRPVYEMLCGLWRPRR